MPIRRSWLTEGLYTAAEHMDNVGGAPGKSILTNPTREITGDVTGQRALVMAQKFMEVVDSEQKVKGVISDELSAVRGAPNSVYYVPNFITDQEGELLWKNVYEAPKPKWKQLANRRLQNWGGLPHKKGLIVQPLPAWLEGVVGKVNDLNPFYGKKANHVLVNEYCPGQGILPHEDGPLFTPSICTVTLGSHAILEFFTKLTPDKTGGQLVTKLLLEPNSLVVLREDMYKNYLHGIRDLTQDEITGSVSNVHLTSASVGDVLQRGTRVSLTIRNLPKEIRVNMPGLGA